MGLNHHILKPPAHAIVSSEGKVIINMPNVWREFFSNLNFYKNKKNWINLTNWPITFLLACLTIVYFFRYFTWPSFFLALFNAMVLMNIQGTLYIHRYGAHKAFSFKNNFWRLIVQNLSIKIFAEETFVLSHHVHHAYPDSEKDPHNPVFGRTYLMLADTVRAQINPDLNETEYLKARQLIYPCIGFINNFTTYKKWGSLCHPLPTFIHYCLNWFLHFYFYYTLFSLNTAFAMFAGAFFWAISVRYFNFKSHGSGKDRYKQGREIHHNDLSLNNYLAGFLAGEWHNSHHLYPTSARSGMLSWQIDNTYYFIQLLQLLGIVNHVKVFPKLRPENIK